MPSLADLLRNDPWGAPPQTPLAKTVTDVGFDPSLGFAGAVQTYLSRLKQMQGGLAQDMLDTAADPNAEGIQRAANLLGGLGLKIANVPMALMPSAQELRDRGYQAGASPEVQAIGGALGDAINIPEPASVGTLLAGLGKAAVGAKGLAGAAAMAGKSAMFIGPNAANFPREMVPVAEGLEAAGKTAEEVHAATGLHRGADGGWRSEIDDSAFSINQNVLDKHSASKPGNSFTTPILDSITHPELTSNYDLSGLPFTLGRLSKGAMGEFNPAKNAIDIYSKDDPEALRQLLIHELQHKVQQVEGFPGGGNPSKVGNDVYQRLAGEVEARNTQGRLGLTSADRTASFPRGTEDVPDYLQIISGAQGGKQAAVAPLGKGLGSLLADATPAEQAALKARLEAEAAQTGGQASSVSREQALNGLTGQDGIIAYHGSPHSFDKFDMSKIGTGEGAQAYGHGLYFAEHEGVAKQYRDELSAQRLAPSNVGRATSDSETEEPWYKLLHGKYGGSITDQYGIVYPGPAAATAAQKGKLDTVAPDFAEAVRQKNWGQPGSMYQVHLDVKPHELLDWDKPLSEQPKAIRDILKGVDGHLWEKARYSDRLTNPEIAPGQGTTRYGIPANSMSGEAYYKLQARRAMTDEQQSQAHMTLVFDKEFGAAATNKLKEAGIKGIRYKDAGSRDGVGGTSNFVIFDDALITILKKYGVPMTAGVGGAMMVNGKDMPPDIAAQLQQQ